MSIQIGTIDHLSAAVEAAKKANPADLRTLRDEIDGMIKAQSAAAAYDAQRAKKVQAALDNPEAPAVRQALATLQRLGFSVEQAANIQTLNAKLDERRWSTEERMRVKAMLHSIGVI
jgi:hypothetical protein